jgi:hypothetical protein
LFEAARGGQVGRRAGRRRGDACVQGDGRGGKLSAEEAARISRAQHPHRRGGDMVRHRVELSAVMQAGGWRTDEMAARAKTWPECAALG